VKDIELITVEVAYALPHRQQLLALKVAPGTTAYEAVRQSGIVQQFPEIDLENVKMVSSGRPWVPRASIRQRPMCWKRVIGWKFIGL